jgi:hypothetical protein
MGNGNELLNNFFVFLSASQRNLHRNYERISNLISKSRGKNEFLEIRIQNNSLYRIIKALSMYLSDTGGHKTVKYF